MEQTILKYGRINEKSAGSEMVPVAMAASQAIKEKGGKFVFMVAGAATLCINTSQTIYGWLNCHEKTPDTGEVLGCDTDLNGIFRIPIKSGTYAVGMNGDVCDLALDADGNQGATLDVSTNDLVIIVNGDTVNNAWVEVKMNPKEYGTGLGTDA